MFCPNTCIILSPHYGSNLYEGLFDLLIRLFRVFGFFILGSETYLTELLHT